MEIALSGKKGAGRVALIDDQDLPLVEGHRWRLFEYPEKEGCRNKGPYAITWIRHDDGRIGSLLMHSAITGWPLTDHENHDGLDNRRANLRPATGSQNQGNRRPSIRSATSRHKGVWLFRSRGRWVARITVDGRKKFLGTFASEDEAALAYNAAALEAWGPYACLNQIDPPVAA